MKCFGKTILHSLPISNEITKEFDFAQHLLFNMQLLKPLMKWKSDSYSYFIYEHYDMPFGEQHMRKEYMKFSMDTDIPIRNDFKNLGHRLDILFSHVLFSKWHIVMLVNEI
ncbi:unnamed protein product [Cuscuta epithymum]|uniref:Uncharacterized protein n=1 Tax=Cuscuta epithymum TaxID=186058 RepID=A0AAV0DHC2_9ASTE|nr:unnamed protein product [Cuscuta epithymum]